MGQFVELLVEIGFLQPHLAIPAQAKAAEAAGGKGKGKGGRGGKGGGRGGGDEGASGSEEVVADSVSAQEPRQVSAASVKALMKHRPIGGEYYNVHATSMPCLRAVLCAGLYPNVARASTREEQMGEDGGKGKGKGGKGGGKGGRRARTPALETFGGAPVELHPSSANAETAHFESRWLVYYEKVRTAKVYLRDATMVTPYPLLLFGGELKVKHAQQSITIDKWIEFDAAPRVAVLFKSLRSELDKLLLQKLATPNLEFELAGRTIGTIVDLLQEEEGVHQGQDAYEQQRR